MDCTQYGIGDSNIPVACTDITLSSPDKSLAIKKLSDCIFTLDVAGTNGDLVPHFANGLSTTVSGTGEPFNPFITEVKISPLAGNAIVVIPGEGLFAGAQGITGAFNGVSMDGTYHVLGNDVGGTAAILTAKTDIDHFFSNLTLSGTGKWGIGTIAPIATVDVIGAIKSSSLSGTGTRVVVAEDTGMMGAIPIPVYYTTAEKTYYVSKKYTGPGAAFINGSANIGQISSTNAEYNTQLAQAIPGSKEFPYPDPWAARNAAQAALTAATIKTAHIVVLAGNTYTVGSNSSASNGTMTPPYAASGHDVADVGFTSAGGGVNASLIYNNIYVDFQETSGLYYINSTYVINTVYIADLTTPDATMQCGVTGKGFIHKLYGSGQGWFDTIVYVDNANASVKFQLKELSFNGLYGFCINNCAEFHAEVDYIFMGNARLLASSSIRATTLWSKTSNVTVKIKTLVDGYQQSLYPGLELTTSSFALINFFHNLYPKNVTLDIKNHLNGIDGKGLELYLLSAVSTPPGYTAASIPHKYIAGLSFYHFVENYKQFATTGSIANGGVTGRIAGTSRQDSDVNTSTNTASNNKFSIYFRNAELISPFFSNSGCFFEGVNNLIHFKTDKCRKNNASNLSPMFYLSTIQGKNALDRNHIFFEGWFEDMQQHLISGGASTGYDPTYGYTKITLKGKFVSRAATKNVLSGIPIAGNKTTYVLDRAQLYNDGTANIILGISAGTEILCLSSVATNGPLDSRIIVKGKGLVLNSVLDTFY